MNHSENLVRFLLIPLCLLQVSAPVHPAPATQGEDAVLLEENVDVEILSETEARVRFLNRTQVLTPRGVEAYSDRWVHYQPFVSIQGVRAAVISPSGKRQELKKSQFSDTSDFEDFESFSDARKRGIHFRGVEPGAILEYSYEESLQGLLYLPDFFLQREVYARKLAFTIHSPPSLPLRVSVQGASEAQRQEVNGTVVRRWVAQDVPAYRIENDMPPLEDLLPRVAIYPPRLIYGEQRIDAATWNGIASWSHGLFRERMAPVPPVADEAKAVVAGVAEPEEKVRRLYEFLQQRVRYVAIELGIGGWQPHANGQVLAQRYGDCKDKATLLIAMMRAVGLTGLPALIRTRDAGLLERDFPHLAFNHVIVAVPRADGYFFLDPTAEETPYGDLPWVDQGVPILVVKEDGQGDLVETPLASPERNLRHRRVTARVTAAGELEGEYAIEAWGQRRTNLAQVVQAGRAEDRQQALEETLAWLCPGAVLKDFQVVPGTRPGDPLKVTAHFAVSRFVMKAGTTELIAPQVARLPQFADLTAGADRRLPVFFPYLFSETSEVRLSLPPGKTLAKVPADRKQDGPGLQASTSYELSHDPEGDLLVVKRSLKVSRREIRPEEFPALRDFFSALAREDSSAVSLAAGS
jgi:hypothetical protein